MTPYKNLNGGSGIYAYETSNTEIAVQFINGDLYLYNNISAGNYNIEHMKKLAIDGKGLNSFINTTVRKRYYSKINTKS